MRPFFLGGLNGFLGTSRARSRRANHFYAMKHSNPGCMAYLQRFIFILLLIFFCNFANAACTKYQVNWRGTAGPLIGDKAGACSAINGMSYSAGSGDQAYTVRVSGASVDEYGNCSYKETTTYVSTLYPPYVGSSSAAIIGKTVTSCGCPVGMEENSSGACVCKPGLGKSCKTPNAVC